MRSAPQLLLSLLELLLELESLLELLQLESLLPLLQLESLTLLPLQPESPALLPPDSVVLQLQPLPPPAFALDESSIIAELGGDEELDQKLSPLRRRSSSRRVQSKGSSTSSRSHWALWKPQRSRQARQRARIDSNIGTPESVPVQHPRPARGSRVRGITDGRYFPSVHIR
jgi:hypothetical protein